jgi:hypothetical protein
MHEALTTLLNRTENLASSCNSIIKWASPVLAFGDPSSSIVTTVGLNPSNKEFVDDDERELSGSERRFHTLRSLGLKSWSDAEARHAELILDSCCKYFGNVPYDKFFKPLNKVIAGTGTSFYSKLHPACHLDLVPYATAIKWGKLRGPEKKALWEGTKDALGSLLRDSPIRLLILNGPSVVEQFQNVSRIRLEKRSMPAWSLRFKEREILGSAYVGTSESMAGVQLKHQLLILGYNHFIPGGYGLTSQAASAICDWIAQESRGALQQNSERVN